MCEPTDDLGLSPEFLADEDIARDEDNYYGGRRGRCTCGYLAWRDETAVYDGSRGVDERWEGDGCRGCHPPDFENRPAGLEVWEHPAWIACNEECRRAWRGGPYRNLGMSHEERMARVQAATPESWRRLCRAGKRAWGRICDEAPNHPAAVREYKEYVARVTRSKP